MRTPPPPLPGGAPGTPAQLPAVRAGIHANPAARRAGDRAGELEPSEACPSCAVQGDGVRCAAAGDEHVTTDLGTGERTAQLQHEAVEALVGDEEVGAQ